MQDGCRHDLWSVWTDWGLLAAATAVLFGFGFRGAIFGSGYDIAGASVSEGHRRENYFYGSVGFEYVFTPKRKPTNGI